MADYLDNVGAQLAQLTARGVDRSTGPTLLREPQRHIDDGDDAPARGRRRREALVVVPALVVAVVVVVGLLALGLGAHHNGAAHHPATSTQHHQTQHRHPASPRTSTAAGLSSKAPASATAPRHVHAPAGPVPPGFGAESFTAIGTDTWWLLGSAPCSTPPCTSILRTDNGGDSFAGTPAPRTTQVSQLRFANAADGFAYDSQLWVTHDAGASWHQVRLGGAVTELATAGGFAYAVVRYGHNGAGRLERAPLGSDTWTTLTGAGSAYAGLWARGRDVLVGSAAGAAVAISHDAGVGFIHASSPSKGLPCDFDEPAAGVVWAHCATGTESATWRSTDSGAQFQRARGPEPGLPNTSLFAAASATTAVVGYSTLLRTTDGGQDWSPVPGARVTAWQYLGFTDATHGVAIGYVGASPTPDSERLYITGDGGAGYHLVSTG
ncbi:MAG TPA: hypothetical protein VHW96_11930 [Solirubrobacteraceae bacterium]|jgi:hypothetical protein|nr:hypothetical protein [Solirubrobacteraceae bacterium]